MAKDDSTYLVVLLRTPSTSSSTHRIKRVLYSRSTTYIFSTSTEYRAEEMVPHSYIRRLEITIIFREMFSFPSCATHPLYHESL